MHPEYEHYVIRREVYKNKWGKVMEANATLALSTDPQGVEQVLKEKVQEPKAKDILELRLLGGLSLEETAKRLQIDETIARRAYWAGVIRLSWEMPMTKRTTQSLPLTRG